MESKSKEFLIFFLSSQLNANIRTDFSVLNLWDGRTDSQKHKNTVRILIQLFSESKIALTKKTSHNICEQDSTFFQNKQNKRKHEFV